MCVNTYRDLMSTITLEPWQTATSVAEKGERSSQPPAFSHPIQFSPQGDVRDESIHSQPLPAHALITKCIT